MGFFNKRTMNFLLFYVVSSINLKDAVEFDFIERPLISNL